MAIIKCKMCGGDIALNEEKTFGTCEYCGSTMTLPKVSDDQRAARFNRGNHFRRQGEFDKALAVYESIVREDDTDAEAHWCCALCRFGIEYVEDPNTYEYLPTCHRASFDSFLDDVDYQAALENSDGITRRQYQKDAAKIAEVQKGILATSQNEEPFDVFLCYKETDDQTKERTRDSIDAQEIYYQLTQEGYRVFFSRITLEDKAGTEYEPYIFAALNSAKVMVAIGSKPEYFNAVWVKNEWSRFLAMMRKDRSKLLLPCYKNMDPYDLPEQLGVLQSYDMAKIGFMQDLIRGIKKVLQKDEPKPRAQRAEPQAIPSGGPSTENLLKRGRIFLEERNWESATEYFNKVLDIDAENGSAYLGLSLSQSKLPTLEAFTQIMCAKYSSEETEKRTAGKEDAARIAEIANRLAVPGFLEVEEIKALFSFSFAYDSRVSGAEKNKERTKGALAADRNYVRAMQFADPALKATLNQAEARIMAACDQRIEQAKQDDARKKEDVLRKYESFLSEKEAEAKALSEKAGQEREVQYQKLCTEQQGSKTESELLALADSFEQIGSYKDAEHRVQDCRAAANEAAYRLAKERMEQAGTPNDYLSAAELFRKLSGYRDAEQQMQDCRNKADRLQAELDEQARLEAEERKRQEREAAEKARLEQERQEQIRQRELAAKKKKNRTIGIIAAVVAVVAVAAILIVTEVFIPANKYRAAETLFSEGKYEEAAEAFLTLGNYSDSAKRLEECSNALAEERNNAEKEESYNQATELLENKEYHEALIVFQTIEDYKDSRQKVEEIQAIILENDSIYLDSAKKEAEKDLLLAEPYLAQISSDYAPAQELRNLYNELSTYSGNFTLDVYSTPYSLISTFRLTPSGAITWNATIKDGAAFSVLLDKMDMSKEYAVLEDYQGKGYRYVVVPFGDDSAYIVFVDDIILFNVPNDLRAGEWLQFVASKT